MAEAVERALAEAHVLICEAGTGTGKTLAYLVPAILSGQRVVISTATKALQEQIVDKDIPLIARHLGLRPRVALVKGLGNYLCLRRFAELRKSANVVGAPELRRSLPLLESWAKKTETGDVAELTALGESDPLLAEVTSSSETRIGSSCEYYEECFVTRMKKAAAEAEILVVNHHLFFADVAVKLAMGEASGRGGALPSYDAVIFDEAHQLEDIATDFFGVRLSEARLGAMLRDAERAFFQAGLGDRLLTREDGFALVSEVRRAVEVFFRELAAKSSGGLETKVTLEPDAFSGALREAYLDFDTALETLETFAEANATREAVDVVKRRAAQARADAARIVDPATNQVVWVEIGRRSVSVGASLVDVGGFLAEKVLSRLGGVVLTSATLSTTALTKKKTRSHDQGADLGDRDLSEEEPSERLESRGDPRFSFVRARLGLDDLRDVAIEELHVESPFDHPTRALLYLPRDLPEVTAPDFLVHAGERVRALVETSGGGAFILSTSLRGMQALARSLSISQFGEKKKLVMVQGDAPKSALLARFREHGSAVLVATMSFWEGVDVPGDALRMVVIDRIPFAVPTDPVVAARAAELQARGENPFSSYSVPQAAITLRQGFGRLLRAQTDRGVVAVLDRRLATRGYGKRILDSLPKARRTEELDDVRDFFGGPSDPLKARS